MKEVKSRIRKVLLAKINIPMHRVDRTDVAISDSDFNYEVAERILATYILNERNYSPLPIKEHIVSIREDREFNCFEIRSRRMGNINYNYKSRMETYIVTLYETQQDIEKILQHFYIQCAIEASKEMLNSLKK